VIAEQHGFEATCNRHRNMLGAKDHDLRRVIQDEGFVLVTDNASDFRPMLVRDGIHPGLVVMPATVPRHRQRVLAAAVIEYVVELARALGEAPGDFMINKRVSIDEDGNCSAQDFPAE
jgi:hypothetical protein